MGSIMKMALSSKIDVFTQLSNRLTERAQLHELLISNPEEEEKKLYMKPGNKSEIRKVKSGEFILSEDFKDSFFSLAKNEKEQEKRYVRIHKINGSNWDNLSFTCFVFKNRDEFFKKPFPSSWLGIYKWQRGKYERDYKVFRLSQLKMKLVCIPYSLSEKDFVLLPMSHELLSKNSVE